MSVAPPPDPLVPIFNPLYWETTVDGGGITPAYLNSNFLKFPYAQGLENLQNTNIVGTLAVSGTSTLSGTLSATGAVNLGGALVAIPTSLGDYSTVTPTDATTKIPTTAWVQTAISAGGGSPTVLSYFGNVTTGSFTPAIPAGTVRVDILLMGGGGASGTGGTVWNGSQAGVALGGAGGAGGCVYIQKLAVLGSTTIGCNITVGTSVSANYTGSYGGTSIATAYWGANGSNGSFTGANACAGGAGGAGGGTVVNVPAQAQTGTSGTSGGQQNGVIQTLSPPPWNLSNLSTTGGANYLSKTFNNQGTTLGGDSTLNGTSGAFTYNTGGVGGIIIWCYSSP